MKRNARVGRKQSTRPPVVARNRVQEFCQGLSEWVINGLLLIFVSSALLQGAVVPTGSMENTVLIGDHLLVDKLAYAPAGPISSKLLPYRSVRRGDVIVFKLPPNPKETYVKRVVGMPGDRIRLINKELWVNGKKQVEPYAVHKFAWFDNYRDNFPAPPDDPQIDAGGRRMLAEHTVDGEIVVPAGNYFAMGDNRDNSLDSRYWGFVPQANIIGKPIMVYWSFDAPTEEWDGAGNNLPHLANLVIHFFDKTRWERTFLLIRSSPIEN